jgi:hypothetical protein
MYNSHQVRGCMCGGGMGGEQHLARISLLHANPKTQSNTEGRLL